MGATYLSSAADATKSPAPALSEEARLLLHFLRRSPVRHFQAGGNKTTAAAFELHHAGLIRLTRHRSRGVTFYRATLPTGGES